MKFTPQGKISIESAYDAEQSLLWVQVRDTGIGITEENLKRLFRPYGKLEQRDKINQDGIGLGLVIC